MTTTATESTSEAAETATESAATEAEATAESATAGDESALGDAGKKALDAMKAAKKAAEQSAREAQAELAALKAAAEGREAQHKAEQEAQRVKDEALSAANNRILKAEVRAASAGKLADPTDALRYIDTTDFEVDDEGNFDADAIAAAVDDLIKSKPYLAAATARFEGTADAGARTGTTPAQLTREQLASMTPDQIVEAQNKGQLNELLGIKANA